MWFRSSLIVMNEIESYNVKNQESKRALSSIQRNSYNDMQLLINVRRDCQLN